MAFNGLITTPDRGRRTGQWWIRVIRLVHSLGLKRGPVP